MADVADVISGRLIDEEQIPAMIKVLFFARLREQLDCAELQLAADHVTDVNALRRKLLEHHPGWQEFLVNRQILVAVNQTLAKDDCMINDGDEVAFFPPVTGG